MKWIVSLLFLPVLLCQCSTKSSELSERDLLREGMPITIKVPDSVDIKSMDWGLQKDITLQGEGNYNLQIFSSQTTTPSMPKLVSQHKEMVRTNPYFAQFIQEDEDGFLYSTEVDSLTNFSFRHFKIQGDREYIFQTGMIGTFTQEEAASLYQIAQEAK